MTTQTLNALAKASSAYLRSAMHQPIYWHEWGEEAFATARRENKPILLDIGAVWCHWCHVMDRESYDDPEIAQLVNERFVAVKVDRDERPDIDSRYQVAVSSISGQGGWPLTAFLTPDGKPCDGGTYFPPDDHWGRPGFKRVLLSIANAYREKHGDVVEQAKMVEGAISHAESFTGRSAQFSPRVIDAIVKSALQMFDSTNGGFGQAPKFPHPAVLDLLIERYAQTGNEELHEVFATTLERMANGGVYASQDADYSLEDDGDYFTWTVQEAQEVLTEEEAKIACLYYDINEVGEMHHNPAKNVPYVRASVEEIARCLNLAPERVQELLNSAKKKMYAARLKRPTPYVDKTVYVGWNALCVSAYLEAAKVLALDHARRFAL